MPRKKQRASTEEVFGELADLKMEIQEDLFIPEDDDPCHIPKKDARVGASFEFHRAIFEDLKPDPDFIEDDLVTNAAIYAYYGSVLSKARRYLARCRQEYDRWYGRVYQEKSREIYRDPDLEEKIKTQAYIKAEVINTQSIALLQSILDDAYAMVHRIEEGMKALEQKHYNCQAIARIRSGEAKLVGSTYVPRDKRESDETSSSSWGSD